VLELICHTHSHNCIRTSGVHDWRRAAVAAVVTWSLVMVGISLGYGLDFLLGTLALERGMLPWLAIGSRVCFQNYSVCQG
jgi:hypothetical protein